MKAISRAIDKFCLKHRRFGITGLMKYIVFITAIVFVIELLTGGLFALMVFSPRLFMSGEVWRIVTWVFFPIDAHPIFFVFVLYLYYMFGTSLEREWGAAKFTIFYIFGVLLNIIYGFVAWFALGWDPFIVPTFLNLSIFFAFAVKFPDFRLMLFFILPVKIKWLAIINAAFFAYDIIFNLVNGRFVLALLPVVAILNFLLICGYDLIESLRPMKARAKNQTSSQTINFKKAAKKVQQTGKPYRHKCAVCGRTDTDNPGLEFRYCSRCNGYHCFCIDHINNHVHFQ